MLKEISCTTRKKANLQSAIKFFHFKQCTLKLLTEMTIHSADKQATVHFPRSCSRLENLKIKSCATCDVFAANENRWTAVIMDTAKLFLHFYRMSRPDVAVYMINISSKLHQRRGSDIWLFRELPG